MTIGWKKFLQFWRNVHLSDCRPFALKVSPRRMKLLLFLLVKKCSYHPFHTRIRISGTLTTTLCDANIRFTCPIPWHENDCIFIRFQFSGKLSDHFEMWRFSGTKTLFYTREIENSGKMKVKPQGGLLTPLVKHGLKKGADLRAKRCLYVHPSTPTFKRVVIKVEMRIQESQSKDTWKLLNLLQKQKFLVLPPFSDLMNISPHRMAWKYLQSDWLIRSALYRVFYGVQYKIMKLKLLHSETIKQKQMLC